MMTKSSVSKPSRSEFEFEFEECGEEMSCSIEADSEIEALEKFNRSYPNVLGFNMREYPL